MFCFHSQQIDTTTRKRSQYSERDAAKIVRQMLKVVASCHLHGIVHRDLKPEVGYLVLEGKNVGCIMSFVCVSILNNKTPRICLQNFLFKFDGDNSELKAIDFGLSDYVKPGELAPNIPCSSICMC